MRAFEERPRLQGALAPSGRDQCLRHRDRQAFDRSEQFRHVDQILMGLSRRQSQSTRSSLRHVALCALSGLERDGLEQGGYAG